jgi:hypothetical protein
MLSIPKNYSPSTTKSTLCDCLKARDLASMQRHVDGETSTITHFYDEKFRSLDE